MAERDQAIVDLGRMKADLLAAQEGEHRARAYAEATERERLELLDRWNETMGRCIAFELEVEKLREGIREHRDARGDDRCWMDDLALYEHLPEGVGDADLLLCEPGVMLEQCKKFIASRHDPSKEYLSPEREIERLKQRVAELEAERRNLDIGSYICGKCALRKDPPRDPDEILF